VVKMKETGRERLLFHRNHVRRRYGYAAPEVAAREIVCSVFNNKADIWSLWVLVVCSREHGAALYEQTRRPSWTTTPFLFNRLKAGLNQNKILSAISGNFFLLLEIVNDP